jgi:hypothetical protein
MSLAQRWLSRSGCWSNSLRTRSGATRLLRPYYDGHKAFYYLPANQVLQFTKIGG